MREFDAAATENATIAGRIRTNDRHAFVLIPLLAFFIVHPLILHGCSCGHDFDFHLFSWFEAATQIAHGNLHPHWAYTPAWNAGEPRFVFYPPASWYLGALLGLVLTHLPGLSEASAWAAAPVLFTWIALSLSGLTMFRLARQYTSTNAALIAATVYLANPYMLFTAYERTAYGELLAAAWLPLLFEGILRERISVPRLAIPVALLWLTNVPAAVMACYALALLAAMRIFFDARAAGTAPSAVRCVAATALGFGLAAFYILPAAYERRYVQAATATIGDMRTDANFLFRHTGSSPDDLLHDQVLRTASWIAALLLAATVVALITALLRKGKAGALRAAPLPLMILTLIIAAMQTPLSAPVWNHLPEMAFLQFPWRLLALLTPALALAIAVALPAPAGSAKARTSVNRSAFLALGVAAALALPAWHLFRQPCDPEDTAASRIALFHSNAGSGPTDEYTPVTADNDALPSDNPSWWLADFADAPAPAQNWKPAERTAPMHLVIDAPYAEFLVLNLRDYPAWRITLTRDTTAQIVNLRGPRSDGLIAIAVPGGQSTIDIHYSQPADEAVGDGISIVALAAFIVLVARRTSFAATHGLILPTLF